jgi:transcriptional regulator with XRE-family HTH domain
VNGLIERSLARHGIGVRELARRLGVTPGAVTAYKRSESDGRIGIDTLNRVLAAMGETAVVEVRPLEHTANPRPRAPFARREDRVAYELHRAIAKRLLEDREGVMAKVPEQVLRMREHARGGANRLLDEWLELTTAPLGRVVETLLGEDEHAVDMRQTSPFMGVLTEAERLAAIERARAA